MPDPRAALGPADLHTHSTVSDGTDSPAAVVEAAAAAGLACVALTDHDATSGWSEAAAAASRAGIAFLPGMELSTHDGYRSVHLLAYLVDPDDPALVAETARIRQSRLGRAEEIVRRIGADHDLTWQHVLEHTAPGATVGRPHIADALVALGLAEDRGAAFAGILHPASGYYLPHEAPSTADAIELVRRAGGVPVMAHPATRSRSGMLSDRRFRALAEAGLFGLEVWHRENTDEGRRTLLRLADELGLVTTGSSDYHGSGKPNRIGEHTTDADVVARIVEAGSGAAIVPAPDAPTAG